MIGVFNVNGDSAMLQRVLHLLVVGVGGSMRGVDQLHQLLAHARLMTLAFHLLLTGYRFRGVHVLCQVGEAFVA